MTRTPDPLSPILEALASYQRGEIAVAELEAALGFVEEPEEIVQS